MPSHHRQYQEKFLEWTPERVISWGRKIGPATAQAIEAIMATKRHPEQNFRACIGVIRLAKTWSIERLEAACCRALEVNACSYKNIKLILESSGDRQPNPRLQLTLATNHENVRGPEYYGQTNNEVNENVIASNN
jgi:transposase